MMHRRKREPLIHRLQREQYNAHRLRNPYFRKNRVPEPGVWKRRLIAIGIVTVIGLLGYAGIAWLRAPDQQITDVTIEGTRSIREDEVRNLVNSWLDTPRGVFFSNRIRPFSDVSILRDTLTKTFVLESLNVATDGNVLRIVLTEKTSQLIWRSGDNRVLVDLQGIVIRPLQPEEIARLDAPPPAPPVEPPPTPTTADQPAPDVVATAPAPSPEGEALIEPPPPSVPVVDPLTVLPVFVDLNRIEIAAGTRVLTPEEIQVIFRFHDRLRQLTIQFHETRVDRLAGKWMSVRTQDGYDIFFDPSGDANMQADNLATILKEKITDPKRLQYIDLRFGDHVYFK